jgi:RNA polymerase sigma-70 factor (ECF subfamily)
MINDMATAEDVAQLVFTQAWKAAGRYKPNAQLITWLLRITRNQVLNEIRRRSRKGAQSLDADNLPESFTAGPSHDQPDHQMAQAELLAAVEGAIAELPESQRSAILLVRHENLSYEEIATILGTTVPSVKSLVFRARTELKQRLKKIHRSRSMIQSRHGISLTPDSEVKNHRLAREFFGINILPLCQQSVGSLRNRWNIEKCVCRIAFHHHFECPCASDQNHPEIVCVLG